MATNPLFRMLGAALTAPGDYTRGLASRGQLERVTPQELLGDEEAGWLPTLLTDLLTDPTALPMGLGMGSLGMAMGSLGRGAGKQLTAQQIAQAAKNAAKKARKRAAREAAQEVAPSGPQLLQKRLPEHVLAARAEARRYTTDPDHLKRWQHPDEAQWTNTVEAEQFFNPDDLVGMEPLPDMRDDIAAWADQPGPRARHLATTRSLRENPLFESRLLQALQAADPQVPIETPRDILESLRGAGLGDFDESELQLLLSRFMAGGSGQPIPASNPYYQFSQYSPEQWLMQSDWKDLPLDRLPDTPATLGGLRDFARRYPPVRLREYSLDDYVTRRSAAGGELAAPRVVSPAPHEGANIPGNLPADYHATLLYPYGRNVSAARVAGEEAGSANPTMLERWSQMAGDSHGFHNKELLPQGVPQDPLVFMLWREMQDRQGQSWLSLNQLQGDLVETMLQGTDPTDAIDRLPGFRPENAHPIAKLLKRRYPDIGMARLVREAAERDWQGVMWHPGLEVRKWTYGEPSGQVNWYGRQWPTPGGRMHDAARRLERMIPGARLDRVDLQPANLPSGQAHEMITGIAAHGQAGGYLPEDDLREYLLEDILGWARGDIPDEIDPFMLPDLLRHLEPDVNRAPLSKLAQDLRDAYSRKDTPHGRRTRLIEELEHLLMDPESGRLPDDLAQQLLRHMTRGEEADYVSLWNRRTGRGPAQLHYGPRWGLHLPPESREFIRKKLRVPMLGLGGAAGGGALLQALQEANTGA